MSFETLGRLEEVLSKFDSFVDKIRNDQEWTGIDIWDSNHG